MSDHTKINQQNKQQDQKRQEQSHENSSAMQSFAPPDSAIQPITDNRPGTVAQRRLQELMDKSPQVQAGAQLQSMIDNSPRQVAQRKALKNIFGGDTAPVQRKTEEEEQTIQAKENNTGLPDNLKTGVENLSGMSMDDVKVHSNSSKPAELNALAYAQGKDIHLGPGQEKHLPHEAWHVVQQRQGRVKPTMQMKGVAVNDEDGLEKEADVMGEKAMVSEPSNISPALVNTRYSEAIQKKTDAGNSILNELDTTGAGDSTKMQDKLGGLSGVEASKKMAQSDLERINAYVEIFKEAGAQYGIPPALLAGISSRESRGGKFLNKEGFSTSITGFGIMQVDKNSHKPEGAYDSKEHVMQAARILSGYFKQIQKKHPKWTKAQQLRGAVAGYNFGVDDVKTLDGMDKGSTGDDYSSDIWERAKYYASLPAFSATAEIAVVADASKESIGNQKQEAVVSVEEVLEDSTTPVSTDSEIQEVEVSTETPAPVAEARDPLQYYTVQEGDTPTGLAKVFGKTVEELKTSNMDKWTVWKKGEGFNKGDKIYVSGVAPTTIAAIQAERKKVVLDKNEADRLAKLKKVQEENAKNAVKENPVADKAITKLKAEEVMDADWKTYQSGKITMIELGLKLIPYAGKHGEKILNLLNKLPEDDRDNLCYVMSVKSSSSLLSGFDKELLKRMSSELVEFGTPLPG